MADICAINGYKEGVDHPEYGEFVPEMTFIHGAYFITLELGLNIGTEYVYGSPSAQIFTFGDSRSPAYAESTKYSIAKLQAYLKAKGVECEEPKWYLDREKFFWTSY